MYLDSENLCIWLTDCPLRDETLKLGQSVINTAVCCSMQNE